MNTYYITVSVGQESGHGSAGFFIPGFFYKVTIKVLVRAVVSYEGSTVGRSALKLPDFGVGQFRST